MSRTISFPIELLSAPKEARHQYLKTYIVAHTKLGAVHDRLVRILNQQGDPAIVIVSGLTGVGKSTLRRIIMREFYDKFLDKMTQDTSFIPIAAVSAVTPHKRDSDFDWDDFFKRGLLTLNEPLVDHKIDIDAPDRKLTEYKGFEKYAGMKPSALRLSFENALIHRNLRAFIIDEAQAMRYVSSGRKLLRQLEIITDVTGNTSKTIVLIGTHDLKLFLNLNAYTARRSFYIPFERYRSDRRGDIIDFQGVIKSLEQHVPVEEIIDLLSEWEFLYAGSCGCVGILAPWVLRAFDLSQEEHSKVLTLDHLKRTALDENQVRAILNEALENEEEEKRLIDDSKLHSFANLKGLIRLPSKKEKEEQNNKEPEKKQQKRRNKRPGLRNPTRDPVGVKQSSTA